VSSPGGSFGFTAAGRQWYPSLRRFAELQVASQDIDPLYPVLRHLQRGMKEEQALWHSLLYLAYYNVASSTIAFADHPAPTRIEGPLAHLGFGRERRAFPGEMLGVHTLSLVVHASIHGGLKPWLEQRMEGDPRRDWATVQWTLQQAEQNGRWAAYKGAEVLARVHGWPLEATDMGHAFSTGPRRGLALFYGPVPSNRAVAVRLLNAQGEHLRRRLAEDGVNLGVEQLETVLCDFHAMTDGAYYVGHDIDQLQEQLDKAWRRGIDRRPLLDPVWAARRAVLPAAYLGEENGWSGVDQHRCRAYRETGQVLPR
jgi:hypothetical protein